MTRFVMMAVLAFGLTAGMAHADDMQSPDFSYRVNCNLLGHDGKGKTGGGSCHVIVKLVPPPSSDSASVGDDRSGGGNQLIVECDDQSLDYHDGARVFATNDTIDVVPLHGADPTVSFSTGSLHCSAHPYLISGFMTADDQSFRGVCRVESFPCPPPTN